MSEIKAIPKDTYPPIGGWAEGDYLFNCADCNKTFSGGDKRSCQCPICAIKGLGKITHNLQAENAELRERLRWRKWPDEKPVDGKHVFVRFKNALGKRRTVKACWIPKLFSEAGEFDESDEGWLDYQEETDTYYSPQGWYEVSENAENYMYQMSDQVEYEWLPIPDTGKPDTQDQG